MRSDYNKLMGLFDIFKKKKSEIPKNLTIPKPKFISEEMSFDEYKEIVTHTNKSFKILRMIQKKNKFMVGRINGYHPYPKDNINKFYAVVDWPVHEKTKKNFVVDTTFLVKLDSNKSGHIIYPDEGTWINFYETGTYKDTDGIARTYGIADTLSWDTFPEDMRSK